MSQQTNKNLLINWDKSPDSAGPSMVEQMSQFQFNQILLEAEFLEDSSSRENFRTLDEHNGSISEPQLSEKWELLESVSQKQAEMLFYGDPTKDENQFLGLSHRYAVLDGSEMSKNILDAGGRGEHNTSIWLMGWGPGKVFFTFPKGSKGGLTYRELPPSEQVYPAQFKWDIGLTVKKWQYVVRIANIDVDKLVTNEKAEAPKLVSLLRKAAIDRIPSLKRGSTCFYMNQTVYSILNTQAVNGLSQVRREQPTDQSRTTDDQSRKSSFLSFLEIPLRRVDALRDNESPVKKASSVIEKSEPSPAGP